MSDVEQRTHKIKTVFATEDIVALIRRTPLTDPATFLVLNGGTGVGKTVAVMTEVRDELNRKFNNPQRMAIIESRRLTSDQLKYKQDQTSFSINDIQIHTRTTFQREVERPGAQPYDWVVIDECHGLFSEASFAEDAEYIANWIKHQRKDTKIIFITANDEYFDELSRKYFPEDYNFIYLFPDFTEYISKTLVKEIQFIKTSKTEEVLDSMEQKFKTQKGIVFLRSAEEVFALYSRLSGKGIRAGMVVSLQCQTEVVPYDNFSSNYGKFLRQLTNIDKKPTMSEICEAMDLGRKAQGKEGIREAIIEEHIPEDIDVLISTDTLQEGISIKSHIDFIVIDGFTEVEVRQKLGRFRGNELNLLFIIFNPARHKRALEQELYRFSILENANQTERAEAYGVQMAGASSTLYLKKVIINGEAFYDINEPARLDALYNYEAAKRLVEMPEQEAQRMFGMYGAKVKYLNYQSDIRQKSENEKILEIAEKWKGIPLKGKAQEEIVKDFIEANIRNSQRKPIDSFPKILNAFKTVGLEIQEKQATKKDILNYPNYLSKQKEKYKILPLQTQNIL